MEVVDGCNGFYLYDGDNVACMGDGVDQVFLDRNGHVEVRVGDPRFLQAWQDDVDQNPDMYREAYFEGR